MLELVLIRHAKSSHADYGVGDFRRGLNARGEADALQAGRRLAELGLAPDLVLTSSAHRARETTRRLVRAFAPPGPEVREISTFYLAEADALLAEIQRVDAAWRRVAVVAHNPGISVLHHLLTGESVDMPTCAMAVIRFELDDWRAVHADSGRVSHYEYPALWREA